MDLQAYRKTAVEPIVGIQIGVKRNVAEQVRGGGAIAARYEVSIGSEHPSSVCVSQGGACAANSRLSGCD